MPTNRDAPDREIGDRCASHDRGLNAPSSAQSARASHSPTRADDLGLEALRDFEQLDQLIRPVAAPTTPAGPRLRVP